LDPRRLNDLSVPNRNCDIRTGVLTMKKVALSVVSLGLFCSQAYAATCADMACPNGTQVINSNGYIGTVIAVGPTAVTYTIPGYEPLTSAPSSLSPETNALGAVAPGTVVINSNDYIGKVNHVFANGSVQYTIEGYEPMVSNVKTLAAQVASLPGHADLFAGVTVINANEYIGTVNQVFSNGKVQYTIPGYEPSISNISQLSALVKDMGPLRPGTVVINSNDYIGTVREIFADGNVQYVIPGYEPSISKASTLSPQVTALGALTQGVVVINSNNYVGTVNQLFANGKVQYTIPGYSPSISMAATLSPQVSSAAGYPDITVGVTVVNANSYIGAVQKVFANGQVEYRIPGYDPAISAVETLSPAVKADPQYSKDAYYASDSYQVGKLGLFFKNGKIQLLGVDGSNSIATSKIYPRVAQLNGYSDGTAVVTPGEISGKVSMVFANGAITYTYQPATTQFDPSPKPRTVSARMYGKDSLKIKQDGESWIRNLARQVGCSQNQNGLISWCDPFDSSGMVDLASDLPTLKKQLLALLQQEPELVYDKDLREKVSAELSK
jgi:uncharacterized protein YdbL (DUF1318 family)